MKRVSSVIGCLGLVAAAALTGATPASATPVFSPAKTTVPKASDGWVVVGLGKTTPVSEGPSRLVLISPSGTRYPIGTLAMNWSIADVSPDGQRILLYRPGDVTGDPYALYDVATKKTLLIPGKLSNARLSAPAGAFVLGTRVVSGVERLVMVSPTGRIAHSYGGVTAPFTPTASPDGRKVVALRQNSVSVSDAATGRLLRVLPRPAGYTLCYPTAMWDATQITAICINNTVTSVFSWPVAGGTPTLRARTTRPAAFNHAAFSTRVGTIALQFGNSTTEASSVWFARVGSNKRTVTKYSNPPLSWPATATYSTLYYYGALDEVTPALYGRSLATGKVMLIAGPARDKASVTTFQVVNKLGG